jgi:CubicO group peptidase (beta-lactamase class C family)
VDPSICQRLIGRSIAAEGFQGAALIVERRGRTVLEHYAGEAAPGVAAGPQTLWPLASISKVYTAAMVMRLVEQGELTLNTLVSRVLPRFTGEGREEVRLRHLLTHTAGMIDESPEMEQLLAARTPIDAMVAEALESALLFAPGTAVRYADYHYLLAGRMAEVVTGRSFHELVESLVLEPAGLSETTLRPADDLLGRIAYVRGPLAEGTDGAMYNSAYALRLGHPAFGVTSSVADLVRFARHFAPGGPRIHTEAAVRAMTTDQTGGVPGTSPAMSGYGADSPIPWGIGWMLQSERSPALLSELVSFGSFGHGGASGCWVMVDPAEELIVAILSNTHVRTGPEPWRMRLQSIINSAIAATAEPSQH